MNCAPRIVFKVKLFKNGQPKDCFVHVEPELTNLGELTEQGCTFRIVEMDKVKVNEQVLEIFTRA